MEDNDGFNKWVAAGYGAIIALAAALLALMFRRGKRIAIDDLSRAASAPQIEPETSASPASSQAANPVKAAGTPRQGSSRWTTPTKYIMSVILFLVALGVLFIGRGVISMVLIAAILALFVNPFIERLYTRRHMKWGSAVALTYVLVILVLLLIPLLAIPNLLAALNYLFNLDYQALSNQIAEAIGQLSASLQASPALGVLLSPLLNTLAASLENFTVEELVGSGNVTVTLTSLTSQLVGRMGTIVNIISPLVTLVVTAIFILLMAFQMSLAANQISGWYPDLIPPAYKDEYSTLFEKIKDTWINFLRGQLTLMLIIGVITWLGGALLGVPFSLLMGVIAGLLEIIPSIGPTLAAIPAVLLALVLGSTYLPIDNLVFALIVIGFYVLVQLIENQFIVPRVMGGAVNLPPLIVLIGAMAGATAFGILGALLATPIIATGNVLFQYIYRKILEPPPLPPAPEEKPSIWARAKGWAGRISLSSRKKTGESQALDDPKVEKPGTRPE